MAGLGHGAGGNDLRTEMWNAPILRFSQEDAPCRAPGDPGAGGDGYPPPTPYDKRTTRDYFFLAAVSPGLTSPTNCSFSLPFSTSGVIDHVPRQLAPTTLPAVGGETIAVNALPMPPRMQKVALNGAYTTVPSTLPA